MYSMRSLKANTSGEKDNPLALSRITNDLSNITNYRYQLPQGEKDTPESTSNPEPLRISPYFYFNSSQVPHASHL
jgi:hypothetical protein